MWRISQDFKWIPKFCLLVYRIYYLAIAEIKSRDLTNVSRSQEKILYHCLTKSVDVFFSFQDEFHRKQISDHFETQSLS